jgi:hypothetical protein
VLLHAMQNRTFGPYLAATNRIFISLMTLLAAGGRSGPAAPTCDADTPPCILLRPLVCRLLAGRAAHLGRVTRTETLPSFSLLLTGALRRDSPIWAAWLCAQPGAVGAFLLASSLLHGTLFSAVAGVKPVCTEVPFVG